MVIDEKNSKDSINNLLNANDEEILEEKKNQSMRVYLSSKGNNKILLSHQVYQIKSHF